MKVTFLLFLVFITYSHSFDIQEVPIGNYLTTLRASKDEDYFYFSIKKYLQRNYLYLFLLVNGYSINKTDYCNTNNYPSQSSIERCSFYSLSYDVSDSGKSYYYKVSISSGYSYTIIRYSGSNSYGTFKASGSYTNFTKSIMLDASSNTDMTTLENSNNYFYTNI